MTAPSREAVAERVKATLARALDLSAGEHPMRNSASLYSGDIRLDSLALLRLLVALEQEFAIEIDDEEVMEADLDTVGSLVALVESALRADERRAPDPDPRAA